ncbi:MAG: hypothetical protein SP1CHLAM54_01910 [Chlamydiia bacterium]|nr:hypothetical protein [Chlamydiia bacterium]MCH9615109.1 hypothetical protein [Chlamydiia bacterium]MCH9628569.1 hypothetical protein [Chlamydiia bacterium]
MSEKEEFELPDTVYIRDVDSGVFESIVIKCLSKIEGVSFLGGSLIDHLLGREGLIKGIHVEQDADNHSVGVKIELNIAYGLSIPEKAEEVQKKVAKAITELTGLHVSCVHVIFKGIMPDKEDLDELKEQETVTEYSEEAFQS